MDLSLTGTGIVLLSPTEHDQFLPAVSGVHYVGNSPIVRYCWRLATEARGLARWEYILRNVMSVVDIAGTVVIEGYAFGSQQGTRDCIELGGIIKFHIMRSGKFPVIVPPTTLKKFVTGKGGADKSIVLLEAYKRWNLETQDHNVADAFGLAMIGQAILYGTEGLTQFQQEVVKTLMEPKVKKARKAKGANS